MLGVLETGGTFLYQFFLQRHIKGKRQKTKNALLQVHLKGRFAPLTPLRHLSEQCEGNTHACKFIRQTACEVKIRFSLMEVLISGFYFFVVVIKCV